MPDGVEVAHGTLNPIAQVRSLVRQPRVPRDLQLGTIRILLAICVFMGHMGLQQFAFMPIGSGLFASYAVQAFFIVSGFYMSLVLSGKYQSSRLVDFYRTRFLKIMPLYYICLILMLGLHFGVNNWGLNFFEYLYSDRFAIDVYPLIIVNPMFLSPDWTSLAGFFILLISQVTLVGQEWTYFMATDAQGVSYAGEFIGTNNYLNHSFLVTADNMNVRIFIPTLETPQIFMASYLLIPQAWSLSHELIFYLLVPFLVRLKNWRLVLLTLAFLVTRIYFLEIQNLDYMKWYEFKFFPFELCFFLAGMLSHRLFQYLEENIFKESRRFRLPAILLLVIAMFSVGSLPGYSNWIFYGMLVLLLPFAFEGSDIRDVKMFESPLRSRLNKLDRRAGELAYPLYTSHLAVLVFMYAIVPDLTTNLGALWSSSLILIFSVALAILLLKFIQDPIDRYRRGHLSSSSATSRAERRRRNKHLAR